MSFVEEYTVTSAACNSEMYFNLYASLLYKKSRYNLPEFAYESRTVKNISMEANFLKHESLENGHENCAYL